MLRQVIYNLFRFRVGPAEFFSMLSNVSLLHSFRLRDRCSVGKLQIKYEAVMTRHHASTLYNLIMHNCFLDPCQLQEM